MAFLDSSLLDSPPACAFILKNFAEATPSKIKQGLHENPKILKIRVFRVKNGMWH